MFENDINLIRFTYAPYNHVPDLPYGLDDKLQDPNPGVPIQHRFKHTYYVKPTYFFMVNTISSSPFCVLSMTQKGDKAEIEFAEKSFSLGK